MHIAKVSFQPSARLQVEGCLPTVPPVPLCVFTVDKNHISATKGFM